MKEKNLSTTGSSTREKMLARKKQLESKGSGNSGIVYPKEGTLRMRMKSPGDDQELGLEIVTFYLGKDTGSVISPATFDEPCPFMEKYKELKASSDESDKEFAKEYLIPRRKYLIGGVIFTDEKGTKVDYDGKDKLVQVPRSIYQDIIDLYLDEDEAGDMTDPVNGYDIKIIRAGSGKLDTTYSVRACKNTKLDKEYRGNIDIEGMVREQMKSYDELEDMLNKFLNTDPSDNSADSSEDIPEKKKKKKKHHHSDDI